MATPFLIVDGYNLMHAAGLARRQYAAGDMERCRTDLELLLNSLVSAEVLGRTTVVYDAFRSPGDDNRRLQRRGLTVVFAPQGTDADSEIERLLNAHSAPRQVIVVSSDHRLHKAARRRRARCVDSAQFLAQVEVEQRAPGRRRPSSGRPVIRESENDRKQWEQAFQVPDTSEERPSNDFDAGYLNDLENDLRDDNL